METVLITGANRGIGLELASRYAALWYRVYNSRNQLTLYKGSSD